MKRAFYFVYLCIFAIPLFLVLTILTALTTFVGCMLGGERIFSYYPGKIWSWLTCYLMLCPVTVKGRDNIPKGKSCVFVANHQGAFDIFIIYGFLGVPIKWVMKASLGKLPFVGSACRAAGFIFVDNSSPKAAAKSVRDAEKSLRKGASIAVFPEGSRSRSGKMGRFKRGAFQMAVDQNLPIVPITLNGPYDVLKIGSFFPSAHRMEMVVHPAIYTKDLEVNHKVLQELADETHTVISRDLWEKYQ